jgi:hypothetical protein
MLIKIPRVGMQLMIKYPTYARLPLWGLTLIGALETTIFQVCVKIKNVKEKKNTQQATGYNSFTL